MTSCNVNYLYIRTSQVKNLPANAGDIRDWNANVGSQEIPGVTGKSGLGVQMKQGKGSESFAKRTRWS